MFLQAPGLSLKSLKRRLFFFPAEMSLVVPPRSLISDVDAKMVVGVMATRCLPNDVYWFIIFALTFFVTVVIV